MKKILKEEKDQKVKIASQREKLIDQTYQIILIISHLPKNTKIVFHKKNLKAQELIITKKPETKIVYVVVVSKIKF